MKSKRRNFLKTAGLSGIGLLASIRGGYSIKDKNTSPSNHIMGPQFNMSGYVAPKIDPVRIGIIGMGNRGNSHLETWTRLEGVEIRALCDLVPKRVEVAKKLLKGTDHNPELFAGSKHEWEKLCESGDVDLVIIATPAYMHAKMAVYAMEQGKHACTEVPAAVTMEECRQRVGTSERTRKYCRMLENYSFRPFQLLTLNMAREGFFGDIVHADCAYNTSKMGNNFSKTKYWDMWWLKLYGRRKGNIYPTHGLGPVSTIMDINRGDQFDYLVSIEGHDFMMNAKAKELAKEDDYFKPYVGLDYRGSMNVTTIKTKKGRTIMLQHDASTPTPHDLKHGIYGTRGAALMDPPPPRLCDGNHKWVPQEEFDRLEEKYTPKIIKKMGEIAKGSGHGGSDLIQAWRIVDCLRNGFPMDQDVYDAASWSAIFPLSEDAVLNRSVMEIPDFTNGAWITNKRNMDINLKGSGNTQVLS